MPHWNPGPGVFIGLMALGFIIGTAGHVYKSNFTIGIGIAMVFSATLLLPLLIYATD